MEHIEITELGNDAFRLRPDEGYILVHDGKEYSEAVVKGNINGWSAKQKG